MKRNVTISLDEETARWLRVEAAKQDQSVSRFVGRVLAERRRRVEGYEAARSTFMGRPPRRLRSEGGPLPTREEVHRRGAGGGASDTTSDSAPASEDASDSASGDGEAER